jgi:hypothetical protein
MSAYDPLRAFAAELTLCAVQTPRKIIRVIALLAGMSLLATLAGLMFYGIPWRSTKVSSNIKAAAILPLRRLLDSLKAISRCKPCLARCSLALLSEWVFSSLARAVEPAAPELFWRLATSRRDVRFPPIADIPRQCHQLRVELAEVIV